MNWDRWVGQSDNGPIVMWIKNLIHFRGFRLDLHKFVGPDGPGCYHTHPAKAIRLVLWNGYKEEVYLDCGCDAVNQSLCQDHSGCIGRCFETETKEWRPGMFGWVQPELAHLVKELPRGPSYSLWLRWPVTHKIHLVGPGWPPELRSYASPLEDENGH